MHLPPATWGPFFWHTMHIVALGYPAEPTYTHKKAAKEFFESLQVLIPCPVCREHYADHLQKYPITPHLDSRTDLFKWTVVVHNEVNKMLGKPQYSEQDSIAFYKRLGARGKSPVISHKDFEEVDSRSLAKGIGIGVGGSALIAAILYLTYQQ
jgi:hypothetical protein